MIPESEGILVRFLKGKIPVSTALWLVFVPVYLILIFGVRPLGAWWGRYTAQYDLPMSFLPLFLLPLVALIVSIGTFANAWKLKCEK